MCLNIEQEAQSVAVSATALRMCTGFGLPFFCGHTFLFLESLSWSRKSDVLFTGLSAWEVSDCVWEFFFSFVLLCLWWADTCDLVSLWHDFWAVMVPLCFILFRLDIFADLFSQSVSGAGMEVLTPQLLCPAAVWLSGFFFLPLLASGLISVTSLTPSAPSSFITVLLV